ncbi:MAG: DUF169 domain-containing protein [Candidatus Sulfotelmatobacter sp.]
MNSKLVDAIGLKTHAVALTWAGAAPQGAIQFKPGRWGCVVSVFATVAAKGRVGAFDRKTYGCWGGGVGLGFCNCYENFPGGINGSAISSPMGMTIPKKDGASANRSQDGATDILPTISCTASDT